MALKKGLRLTGGYDKPHVGTRAAGLIFGKWDDDSLYIDTCLIHITNKQTGGLVDYTVKDSDGEVEQGEGVYDLEIEDASGSVLRVIQGAWIAYQETTR